MARSRRVEVLGDAGAEGPCPLLSSPKGRPLRPISSVAQSIVQFTGGGARAGSSREASRTARVVLGLFVGYGYYNTMRRTFPQQMPVIARELGIPLQQIGMPNSMLSAAYGPAKFVASIASDHVPCPELHALGLMFSGLDVAAMGLCNGLRGLSALWGLQGVLQAFGWPLLARIVVTELPPEDQAKCWGILSMAGNVGQMLTPYGMVVAMQLGVSWRGTFLGAGASSGAVALTVWWLLSCGPRGPSDGEPVPVHAVPKQEASTADEGAPEARWPLLASAWAAVPTPALAMLMLCNLLSYFIQKCSKEWGAVYLRSTGLAASDMQAATLQFWAEVGGSAGAFFSGFVSSGLGGRHGFTTLLAALLASLTGGALAWCTRGGSTALPFSALCLLQAVNAVGLNGVRSLVGFHAAIIASADGAVGRANGFMEIVGQVGSVLAGQPLGALAAALAAEGAAAPGLARADGTGWTLVLALLALCTAAIALLHLPLLPQEERRVAAAAPTAAKAATRATSKGVKAD